MHLDETQIMKTDNSTLPIARRSIAENMFSQAIATHQPTTISIPTILLNQ